MTRYQAQSRSPGKERDAETGLDYFGARYYGSTMGRFTSADPMFVMKQKLAGGPVLKMSFGARRPLLAEVGERQTLNSVSSAEN